MLSGSQNQRPCRSNSDLEESIDAVLKKKTYETSFNEGWDALQKVASGNYANLPQFCFGLSAVFANTASIESDVSIFLEVGIG
ncbi:hypothetical protein PHMEG_00037563 [Phytophthora megakarya]|uniref:Uncharacterized protein n=1 Tax=Phytophthora megakarya TaxID=4795 RepID=A0A225UIU8_9STRA|nr:hypothetical protein PHMEG_00037563 [Phytophthora megakarya]